MPFLIDSDVLIDVSRGKDNAIEFVDALTEPFAISQVTALELIVGARDKRDTAMIDAFLSLYSIVPLTESIGVLSFRLLKNYAKSHGLHVFGALIAATAIETASTLITRNRRHYQMITSLRVQIPNY